MITPHKIGLISAALILLSASTPALAQRASETKGEDAQEIQKPTDPSQERRYTTRRLAPNQGQFRILLGPAALGVFQEVNPGVQLNSIDGALLGDGISRLFNTETLGVEAGLHPKFSAGLFLPYGIGQFGGLGNPFMYLQYNMLGLGKLQASYRGFIKLPLRDGTEPEFGIMSHYRYPLTTFLTLDASGRFIVANPSLEITWRMTAQLTDGFFAGVGSEANLITDDPDEWALPLALHTGYTIAPTQFIPAMDLVVQVEWPRLMNLVEPDFADDDWERFTTGHVQFRVGINTHFDFTN